MLKRYFILTVIAILTIMFTSCEDISQLDTNFSDSESDMVISVDASVVENDTTESDTVSDTTDATPIKLPEPVVAKWGDKTVTMEYHTVTTYKADPGILNGVSCGYACVAISNGDNYGFAYIDTDGNILNDKYYQFAYSFEPDGRAIVQFEDNSWRYINTNGEDIGPAEEPTLSIDTSTFYEENGKYGLLSENGTKITDPIFGGMSKFDNDYASVVITDERGLTFAYISRDGKIIELPEPVRNSYIENDRIYCKFQSDNLCTVLDLNGNEIFPDRYHELENCNNKFYAIIENNKLGIIDLDGNIIISPILSCDYSADMNISYGEGYLTVIIDGYLAFVKITEQSN